MQRIVTITEDVYSYIKNKTKYLSKGEKVLVVIDYGHHMIVENNKKERFSVIKSKTNDPTQRIPGTDSN